MLMLRADFFAIVENWILVHNVLNIDLWQVHIGSMPSFLHNLGIVQLIFLLVPIAAIRMDGGHEIGRHTALGAELPSGRVI